MTGSRRHTICPAGLTLLRGLNAPDVSRSGRAHGDGFDLVAPLGRIGKRDRPPLPGMNL
jgi:hypothetical protein